MSELIHLRQRIKAIETIKKITHAMRLISMSSHSQLKNKEQSVKYYIRTLNILFGKVHALAPRWNNTIMHPNIAEKTSPPLVILIGSQKGLCGNFNSALFHLFDNHREDSFYTNMQIIAIGKKAVDHAREVASQKVILAHEKFSVINLFAFAQEIAAHIIEAKFPHCSVTIFSSLAQSFFLQKPHITQLIPTQSTETLVEEPPIEGYIWEQEPQIILDHLIQQYLEARIQDLLFQSLLAEHAARFISMDSSTRNAKTLLETTQLLYNKLRQAKITKELTELSGNY